MRRPDLWLILALTWLFSAIGVTAVFGPLLGLRGWFWLALHHALCTVGVTHEVWRAWRRWQAARARGLAWSFLPKKGYKARYWPSESPRAR